MNKSKKNIRLRRSMKTRFNIKLRKINRLLVYKTNLHIYASIIDNKSNVLFTVSSLNKNIRSMLKKYKNSKKELSIGFFLAKIIGKIVALKALKIGIKNVAFDRSGFKYHGKIKFLAENAKKMGLCF